MPPANIVRWVSKSARRNRIGVMIGFSKCLRSARCPTCDTPRAGYCVRAFTKGIGLEIFQGGLDLRSGIHCLHVCRRHGIAKLASGFADVVCVWRPRNRCLVAFWARKACCIAGRGKCEHLNTPRDCSQKRRANRKGVTLTRRNLIAQYQCANWHPGLGSQGAKCHCRWPGVAWHGLCWGSPKCGRRRLRRALPCLYRSEAVCVVCRC